MNRSFIVAVLTVTMIIMMTTASYAIVGVHNLACDNCHGKFLTSSDRARNASNSCVSCHSLTGEASRMPIENDAMSNYFGSYTSSRQPATGSRSTHTWMARSPSTTNKAKVVDSTYTDGVTTPDSKGLLYGYNQASNPVPLTNTTLCIRCHNVKVSQTYTGARRPYLRYGNVDDTTRKKNDQLCNQCHASRVNSQSHITGSHPVLNRAYSTVYKSNTTAYRRVPISANVFNPTANPGNYLDTANKGKLLCTTCHATHYADSSSATFGDRNTANGFANYSLSKGLKNELQNSKGQLLRTDPIGATAIAINICSSCHKETANINHNGKGQNVQCNHCHGAHVDYTSDLTNPNAYLVRRDFSNMTTDKKKLGSNVKVIFASATSSFKRSDGKGICQICHSLPATIGAHNLNDVNNSNCLVCHKHSNGFSALDCSSCHGYPPKSAVVGGPNGKASKDYTLDETFTPHASHADKAYYNYACKNCHYDGTKTGYHNAGASFADVFIDTAGSVGTVAGKPANLPGDYNASTKVCSNVYCHSNGSPRAGSYVTVATPTWENGKNKIIGKATECNTCHGVGFSFANLSTNAHKKHVVGNNIDCFVCHAATVNSASAITDRTKHADGIKNVSFVTRPPNFVSVFSATWTTGTGNCTTSCHTNGLGVSPATPANWTVLSTGACGTCHAAAPNTSLHTQHFTDPAGPNLGTAPNVCANCHQYSAGAATHANGVVNLNPGNSCSPCHPSTAPIWMTGATVTCESCHTGVTLSTVNTFSAPENVRPNNTLGHGKYSSASLHVKCTSCHNAAAPHIRPAVPAKRLLVAGNALCNTCHIPSIMGVYSSTRANLPAHGGSIDKFKTYTSALNLSNIATLRADACAGCHDTHGTTNLMSVRTTINGKSVTFTNTSSGLVSQSTVGGFYTGLCQVCHTKTLYFRNNRVPENSHMGSNGKNCLSCHTHKGMFAFAAGNGTCGGCHGYPPVRNMAGWGTSGNYINAKLQDYSGGGGAHTMKGHIARTVVEADGMSKCNDCHYNTFTDNTHAKGPGTATKSFVNVVVDPKYKFNNTSTIRYNAQTCSNVSCHFKKSPNWTNGL